MVLITEINEHGDAYIEELHSWIPIEYLREVPKREPQPGEGGPHKTHGKTNTRLYTIYCGMKLRCYNPKAINYKHYGAKGISICEEWLENFETFYSWAVSNGYSDNLEIDRIDPTKGYCPQNCRWVSKAENVARANRSRKKEKKC
ncbi:hypothetical protein [Anaerotruncus colihominis]|uniref:hypothetical protein n=2 Tax=Anaerotruncus colihominis TaxID=169435 RepID=UPI0018A8B11F|nr:hypothetical protein [Anaerotruncus colihominis]